jgi:hypothetical protein
MLENNKEYSQHINLEMFYYAFVKRMHLDFEDNGKEVRSSIKRRGQKVKINVIFLSHRKQHP